MKNTPPSFLSVVNAIVIPEPTWPFLKKALRCVSGAAVLSMATMALCILSVAISALWSAESWTAEEIVPRLFLYDYPTIHSLAQASAVMSMGCVIFFLIIILLEGMFPQKIQRSE